ncbi:MAG TPA: RDD family protein [Chitinophaga sp.]|nr:RDD family protein [Chitinophaga sp.]
MSTQFSFEKEDLLQDLSDLQELRPANMERRFVNLVIDQVAASACGFLVFIIAAFVFGIFLGLGVSDDAESTLISAAMLLMFPGSMLYYVVAEAVFKGQTLGKLITGTRAVRLDGSPVTWKDALLRTLCRIVPFEVFSGFDTITWHDKWTGTRVVRK